MVSNLEYDDMDTTALLGMFSITAGLVFFFTSGAFSIISSSLGMLFQGIGIALIYLGIAFILWNVLSSLNIFLERFVKRS
ncbi:MAG: hypothetical protein JSW00_02475 [Thermoplasmata archaeon]|nr:MAG: hypothetical protein JSW00_02475 [Thermoplasmata archaeon]